MSTILAGSTACQESRLGTTLGKGITPRIFESMALERRVSHLDSSPRGCIINRGVLKFLSEDKKTMYYTKLLLERAEQDGETIRRDAHRPRARCPADREEHHLLRLPFVGEISFRFLFSVFSNSSVLKWLRTLATAVSLLPVLHCTV